MAETTKKVTSAETKKRVTVRLPRNKGQNANQDEFFSANFQNYIIQRGEDVEIPEVLANIIRDNEKAEEYAMRYADEIAFKDAKPSGV